MLVFESKARPKERWLLIQLKIIFKYYNLGIPKRFPQNMKKPLKLQTKYYLFVKMNII